MSATIASIALETRRALLSQSWLVIMMTREEKKRVEGVFNVQMLCTHNYHNHALGRTEGFKTSIKRFYTTLGESEKRASTQTTASAVCDRRGEEIGEPVEGTGGRVVHLRANRVEQRTTVGPKQRNFINVEYTKL
jgi:hypothetical protein